jgi:hypothetical protein
MLKFLLPASENDFTIGTLDKLDHNPTSTTAQSSFHGTGIILFQFPTDTNPGAPRPIITISPTARTKDY